MATIEQLQAEIDAFFEARPHLDPASVDEYLYENRDRLTADEKNYLNTFIERWNEAQAEADAMARSA